MNVTHSVLIISVTAVVTALLRFLPFLVFGGNRKTPEMILYLGRVLPAAIMGMLVVYCYKGIDVTAFPFGLPELIAGAAVVGMHLWRRNTLLSILSGTVIYMMLIRFVFI
ncbi:MAG: AzlD domain-containing protein [Clostridia bacterium]|nr:AzlD domain-containing protein [Clostridia bacterium]